MARNNRPIIIIAAVLGVLALLSTMFVLFSGGGSPAPAPGDGTGPAPLEAPKQVQYEAIRDIPPRTLLTSSLFRPIDADSSNAIPGALTNLDELNGRLSNETIGAGQIVTRDMTVEPVARVIPANIPIPPNTRAVAIFVDPNQTAAGLVDRGDRVDVIATHTFPVTTAPNQRVSGAAQVTSGRVIAQDLLVLAVDKSIAAPPRVTPPADAQDPNAAPPAVGAPPPVPTPVPPPVVPGAGPSLRVLLAAPIEVATRLVAAEEDGKLHIVIRNPSTTEQFPVPEAREYPSRVVQNPVVPVAKPAAANTANTSNNSGSGGSSNGNATRRRSTNNDMMGEPPLLPAPNMNTTVSLPPAAIPPANNNAPVIPPPAPAREKEITVIRGTEKTRVIVPR